MKHFIKIGLAMILILGLVFLAPLDYHKGFMIFAEALVNVLEKDNGARGILATYESGGMTPYSTRLNELENILGKNNPSVQILEGTHNVVELLSISNAAVFPQNSIGGATGYPITLMEAMASKVLTISSDLETMKEVINHNRNGYLFKNKDAEDLAQKMIEVMNLNFKKRRQVIEEAHKLAVEKFSISKSASTIENLYNK